MRRALRRDDNEKLIVKALRQVGASIYRLNEKGVPDLLVAWGGKMFLLEVKRGKGTLTKNQVKFRRLWKGPMPAIVRDDMEALAAIGAWIPPPLWRPERNLR